MKRKLIVFSLVALVAVLLISIPSYAAAAGEPPGLAKAIAAQEKHQEVLLNLPGVTGVAVGLDDNNQSQVIIFTETPGVRGLPAALEGVTVRTVISGKFEALARPSKTLKNTPPVVTITSPINGAIYNSGDDVPLTGTASDKQDLNLTSSLQWKADGIAVPGTGSGLTLSGLTDGAHTIVASVTDSGGLTASASVGITVGSFLYDTTDRWPRPVPIGISTGHPAITAGTIGARVTVGTNVYALSNNHVFANENQASIGDNVLQPGTYDGGSNPADAIGTLFKFSPIVFSRRAYNTIDAAIALCSTGTLGKSTPSEGYGTPSSTVAPGALGMAVQKFGRTTGITRGSIYAINATINVSYDSGTARFVNQIIITPGTFSAGGDSGSLIVGYGGDYDKRPVGLLFAGSSSYTIANPIQAVLDYFNVSIDGGS